MNKKLNLKSLLRLVLETLQPTYHVSSQNLTQDPISFTQLSNLTNFHNLIASNALVNITHEVNKSFKSNQDNQDACALVISRLLASEALENLEHELYDKGIRYLASLPQGVGKTSVVLDAGEDLVVRIGTGEVIMRMNLEEVLQPIYWGHVGELRYEILPKVDTIHIDLNDLNTIRQSLNKKGYQWLEASLENIGIYHNIPIITDPIGIVEGLQETILGDLKLIQPINNLGLSDVVSYPINPQIK